MDMINRVSNRTYCNMDDSKEIIDNREKLAEIGHLAVGLAHEINNPLGYIISNFSTLSTYMDKYKKLVDEINSLKNIKNRSTKKDQSINICQLENMLERYNLDSITNDLDNLFSETEEGLDRIKDIVTSIKEFSRIEQQDDLKEFYLYKCIDRALLLSKNEVKYVAVIEKDYSKAILLEGNENQMVQVFLNLILNAAYAIKCRKSDKPGIIKVRTYYDKEFAYCEVSDNGMGIPQENLKMIFDPYFTTKPQGHGTGLGLSISYDIVEEKHNGKIYVESTSEIGSKFTVRLPLKKEELKNHFI